MRRWALWIAWRACEFALGFVAILLVGSVGLTILPWVIAPARRPRPEA